MVVLTPVVLDWSVTMSSFVVVVIVVELAIICVDGVNATPSSFVPTLSESIVLAFAPKEGVAQARPMPISPDDVPELPALQGTPHGIGASEIAPDHVDGELARRIEL